MQNEINRLTKQLRYLKRAAFASSLASILLAASFFEEHIAMLDAIGLSFAPTAWTRQEPALVDTVEKPATKTNSQEKCTLFSENCCKSAFASEEKWSAGTEKNRSRKPVTCVYLNLMHKEFGKNEYGRIPKRNVYI